MAARTAADGKWVRRTAWTAADGVGATEWLEMGREKGKEGKGWERKGQEGKGRDWKGKEGKGWERKEKGRERKGKEGNGRERKGKEGKGCERTGKEGKGCERNGKGWERKGKELERTAADGLGAREWLEMGGEKKPLVMSDLGCADGCGRGMGAEKCADGWRERNGVAAIGCGEEAAGDERAWLRGRLRTANGCGELRGRLRTAWVQRNGWKWVGRRSRW